MSDHEATDPIGVAKNVVELKGLETEQNEPDGGETDLQFYFPSGLTNRFIPANLDYYCQEEVIECSIKLTSGQVPPYLR